jgi:outer membrane receptor protein involved in Fe transport
MRHNISGLLACLAIFTASLRAAELQGKVTDPSGKPVANAQVSIVSRVGVEAQTVTGPDGAFRIADPGTADEKVVVNASGFSTQTLAPAANIAAQLEIAPISDSVSVEGSAIDASVNQQGGSATVVTSDEIRQRNEPFAVDLLRETPGLSVSQSGYTGAVATMFLRGGYSNFNLVQIDGVTVNQFGGAFDFAHMPTEALDQIEIARGPQSAVYGPYANSGAVNFITRQPHAEPEFDVLFEGGSFTEHREAITGTATLAGFGIAATLTRLDTNGPVVNSDYWNELAMLTVTRRHGRQSLTLHADIDANDVGEPGPYGSNPEHIFTGIDKTSRSHNDFGNYFARYTADISNRVREEITGSFFQNLSGFTSPYGFSYEKDWRAQGEARTIVSVARNYTLAFGVAVARESFTDTYVTNAQFQITPLHRNDYGFYLENRFDFLGGRLFVNAGVRGDVFQTLAIPSSSSSQPAIPANTISRANPKGALSYLVAKTTRLHTSVGTGMRPPAGFDLAFTTNPAIKPERTAGFDAGIEQALFHNRVLLDGTYFYNRYYALIVSLGGSLTALSHFSTDNLANSRAQGAEFSASVRPARWLFLKGSYTLLRTRVLSLDNSNNQAPTPFQVGEQLLRRPDNSGSMVATLTRGKVSADLTGYYRGGDLDVEPSYGASAGLFKNPGYANIGVNLNYAVTPWMTVYGNLRNALDKRYEEIFGFPSPRLNFVAGMKFAIRKGTQ